MAASRRSARCSTTQAAPGASNANGTAETRTDVPPAPQAILKDAAKNGSRYAVLGRCHPRSMSAKGQTGRSGRVRDRSGYPAIADEALRRVNRREGPQPDEEWSPAPLLLG